MEKRVYELSTSLDEMLAVVQDQQEILFPQVAYERVDERAIRLLAYPKHVSHDLWYEFGLRERGQLHEPCPVRVGRCEVARHLQSEPCLSAPASSRKREHSRHGQGALDLDQFVLPTDE